MFTSDADFQRADWPLLQNGAVNLFWRPAILAEAMDNLRKLGYEIGQVSCHSSRVSFNEQFSQVLRWKEQFGYYPWSGNLNALNDGLCDYPFGSAGRSTLVLDRFHLLANEDSKYSHAILDIIESAARNHLLTGKILICLVQTDDNHYECPHIGCRQIPRPYRSAVR
jgi:Barstar (barnase inhibitor)